jgi:ribonuclease D
MAIVRDLHKWRDGLARKADRPPFKIIGNDAIIEIAKEKPQSTRELGAIKGVPRYHVDRYGRDLVQIVARAMAIPEAELPEKNEPKAWIRDRALESRIEKLKRIRDRHAAELKIDGSMLAPRHVLTAIAMNGSLDVPAMREWQKTVIGEALLDALK